MRPSVAAVTDTIEGRIAFIQREIAQMQARDEALRLAPRSSRRKTGASIGYFIRLDPAEVAALEARSAVTGIKPTVLARNLLRTGLAAAHGTEIAAAVDLLEAAVTELRAAIN